MVNYTTKDIKNLKTLIQMESGKVIVLDPLKPAKYEAGYYEMVDMVKDGNLVKDIGVKFEFRNGDWIKTDGKSIASRNITDSHFIEYLSKMLEAIRPLYLEGYNNSLDECELERIAQRIDLDTDRISEKYGYHF